MVMPGVTTRKLRVNRELCGRRTALTVCQAISIAMTVVLPAPVASLRANRGRSGLASRFGAGQMVEEIPAGAARLRRHLGEPDGGLDRLDLAEEGPDAAETVMPPVLQQAGGFRGHAPLVGVGEAAPGIDLPAYLVDDDRKVVLLPPSASFRDASSNTRLACSAAAPRRFLGLGMGLMKETRRRASRMRFVSWPLSSSSQWRDGYS